jgi:thioredoxin-like negative regulator of GroEL
VAPVYERLSSSFSRPGKITFVKVNTDEQQEIAQEYGITALPTFMVFRQGRAAEKIRGADVKQLQRVVADLRGLAGESSDASWPRTALPKGYADITDEVEVRGLDMLNADAALGAASVLFGSGEPSGLAEAGAADASDWVESDTDEQLMLYVPFQAQLKLHTIQVSGARAGALLTRLRSRPAARPPCAPAPSASTPTRRTSWASARPRRRRRRRR